MTALTPSASIEKHQRSAVLQNDSFEDADGAYVYVQMAPPKSPVHQPMQPQEYQQFGDRNQPQPYASVDDAHRNEPHPASPFEENVEKRQDMKPTDLAPPGKREGHYYSGIALENNMDHEQLRLLVTQLEAMGAVGPRDPGKCVL